MQSENRPRKTTSTDINTIFPRRVGPWCDAVGIGRSHFYEEKKAGKIKVRKSGRATIVETSPAEYISSLPRA
jgi:hypothetical protein